MTSAAVGAVRPQPRSSRWDRRGEAAVDSADIEPNPDQHDPQRTHELHLAVRRQHVLGAAAGLGLGAEEVGRGERGVALRRDHAGEAEDGVVPAETGEHVVDAAVRALPAAGVVEGLGAVDGDEEDEVAEAAEALGEALVDVHAVGGEGEEHVRARGDHREQLAGPGGREEGLALADDVDDEGAAGDQLVDEEGDVVVAGRGAAAIFGGVAALAAEIAAGGEGELRLDEEARGDAGRAEAR